MKLEFDSISEFEQFLMFSAHIGQAFAAKPQAPAPVQAREPVTELAADIRAAMMQDFNNDPDGVPAPDTAEPDYSADAQTGAPAPKRKRRTKAEIAADQAAALQARGDSGELAVAATQALAAISEPDGANPFAAPAGMQAILDAPTHAASLAAAAAVLQAPMEESAPAPAVEVSGIDHLRACQSFIQAHGMQKYNETFRDGLHANIATYTAEQRAQHVAVLQSLAA